MEKVSNNAFKDVTYYIIGNIDEKIEHILNSGGGKRDHYLSETIKYVIVDDPSDAEYGEAKELFELPVVTSRWVILSARCGCLLPTNAFKPEVDQVFSGLTVCPSQLAGPDRKALWSLVTYNGGAFQLPFSDNVTHLVTARTKGAKYEAAMQHMESVEVVTPEWVSDCIEHKALLDTASYHPRLLTDGSTIYDLPLNNAEYPTTPTEADMALADDTKDSPKSAKTKEALARMVSSRIIMAGWKAPELEPLPPAPLPAVLPSPILPTTAAMSPKGVRGMGSGRGAGSRGGLSPRMRGIGSTRGMLRNITNNGMPLRGRGSRGPRSPRSPRARSPRGSPKMSQLIGGLGGHPASMMSPGAFMAGQQLFPFASLPPVPTGPLYFGHDPAESIPEDICLLGCVFYITDYQKYLEKDVLEMWKTVVQQHGGEVDDTYSNRVTHIMCEHQQSDVFQLALRDNKRLVTAHWLNDVLLKKKMQPPWKAIHLPNVYGNDKPCTSHVISVTNFEGEDRTLLKHMMLLIGAKYTGYMTHSNSVLICKKPEGLKYQKALEWQIPVVNVQWLQDILLGDLSPLKLPVQAKYQTFPDNPFSLDLTKVFRFMDGWKVPVRIHKEWKKFHASQVLKMSGNTPGEEGKQQGLKRVAEEVEQSQAKRARQDENTPPEQVQSNGKPCVLITGVTKAKAMQLEEAVVKLGAQLVTRSCQCTHLVANSVSRTVKFLSAFSVAKFCVTTDWVEESAKQGKLLDESAFPLRDEKAETAYDYSIAAALEKACQRKLFKDMSFYLTPSVVPGRSTLKEILTNAGGELVDKQPSITELRSRINEIGQPTFIIISCEDDLRLCKDLTKRKIGVQNAELILTGVIKQELDFESYRIN